LAIPQLRFIQQGPNFGLPLETSKFFYLFPSLSVGIELITIPKLFGARSFWIEFWMENLLFF
jgi:hypothetical protein